MPKAYFPQLSPIFAVPLKIFNLKRYFLISFLSLSLLSSQFGLNIYLFYCCCTKDLSYSIIPHSDSCKSNTSKNKCCAKSITSCSKDLTIKKSPCGNKSIDYKSLNAKAERPSIKDLPTLQIIDAIVLSPWTILNKVSEKQIIKSYLNSHVNSGNHLRKMFCSFTC